MSDRKCSKCGHDPEHDHVMLHKEISKLKEELEKLAEGNLKVQHAAALENQRLKEENRKLREDDFGTHPQG